MSNYFHHLLSLATSTYTVAQIAECFEPNTVLVTFHTIQPSSIYTVSQKCHYILSDSKSVDYVTDVVTCTQA